MKFLFRALFFTVLFATSSAFVTFGQSPGSNLTRVRTFDAQHYIVKTNFDRKARKIFGETVIKLAPIVKNLKIIELDSVGLKYDFVKLESSGRELVTRVTNDKIFITLDREYTENEIVTLLLKYSSKPKKGVYFVDEDKKNSKPAQIWTQGEAAETRHWFPSYDFPDDKATTEQFITVFKGETAISNGELRGTTENSDGTITFHYYMPLPHPIYLTSLIVGKYIKFEDKYNDIPLGFYLFSERPDLISQSFGKTKQILQVFEELTGVKYPFNKYDQAIVSNFTFGGMENITATTLSDQEVFLGVFDSTRGSVEDLIAHEIAHSWFGNLVTNRNWSELWLNEGFATFMEAAFREKTKGRADYIRKIKDDVSEYMAEDSYSKYPHGLFNKLADPTNDDSIFNSITYQKAGAVIHTLRETVGEQAFWKGINLYLERHKFQNVESRDLQKAMEETSKTDLEWFFNQWVYGGGYPKISVKQVFNAKTNKLELTFSQTQKADSLTPEVFILSLDLKIKTLNDQTVVIVKLKKRVETFNFNLTSRPISIEFDPTEKSPLKLMKISELEIRTK